MVVSPGLKNTYNKRAWGCLLTAVTCRAAWWPVLAVVLC